MYHAMHEVITGLWLGSVNSALDVENLRSKNVTRIVSVCDYNPLLDNNSGSAKPFPIEEFKQHYVCAIDDVSEDLISHFDDCFKFIQEGLDSGTGVLVHCQVGISRSATIVIGFLMHSEGVTVDTACRKVSAARPVISPNPGFMSQLALYERMGRRVDRSHPHYRQFQLARFVEAQRERRGYLTICAQDIPCVADPTDGDGSGVYRCKKCRRCLFRSSSLLTHLTYQPKGVASSSDQRMRQLAAQASSDPNADGDDYWMAQTVDQAAATAAVDPECRRELFVEPVEWMRTTTGSATSGKLACPKCSAKIGSFNWAGERCSCGTFVCPAFHLRSQAVDSPLTNAASPFIVARPPNAAESTS